MNAVFSRSTGRMMKVIEGPLDRGACFAAINGAVHVAPHPRAPEYKRLLPHEKQRDAIWPEEWLYRPGISAPLDLFELAQWSQYYPDNRRFAR